MEEISTKSLHDGEEKTRNISLDECFTMKTGYTEMSA